MKSGNSGCQAANQALAEQAANGTYSFSDRRALNQEAQELSKEFQRITQSTSFNDRKLFDGSVEELNLQAGVGSDAILGLGVGGEIGTGVA